MYNIEKIKEEVLTNSYLYPSREGDKKKLLKWFSGEMKEMIEEANQVAAYRFSFTHKWDMEPCRDFVDFGEEIDWSHSAKGDLEWTYMLNRHRFFVILAKAYYITKNPIYLNAFETIISDWIGKNPLSKETQVYSWRTIDAGIRVEHWLEALPFFIEEMRDEILVQILDSLKVHGHYLMKHNEKGLIHSNWSIIENIGLLALGLGATYLPEAPSWKKGAMEHLLACLRVQIHEDGFHWEQSTTYHHEMTLCLMKGLALQMTKGETLNSELQEYLGRMTVAGLSLMKPDGYQAMKGDSDCLYIKEELEVAKWLSGQPCQLNIHEIGQDWYWYFMNPSFNSQVNRTEVAELSTHLRSSGYHVLGSKEDNDHTHIMYISGQIGGGHGHVDLLHFDYWYNGNTVFGDSGRYTYKDDSPLRRRLKEPGAHNTLTIEGVSYSDYVDTWSYGKVAQPLYNHRKTASFFDYAESCHDGYLGLEPGVLHSRGLLYLGQGILLVMDKIQTKGAYDVRRHFNALMGPVQVGNSGALIGEGDEAVELILGEPSLLKYEKAKVSRLYNAVEDSHHLTAYSRTQGSTILSTIIAPAKLKLKVRHIDVFNRWGELLSPNNAFAVELTTRGGSWLVGNTSLYHNQNNHFQVGGQWFLGRQFILYKGPEGIKNGEYK